MDTLKGMLEHVKQYQADVHQVYHSMLSEKERMTALRNFALALIVEQVELLQETPWKPWSYAKRKETDKTKVADEWCDILIFLLDQALCLNLSADDLTMAFERTMTKLMNRKSKGLTP